jgi:hypothetical protein
MHQSSGAVSHSLHIEGGIIIQELKGRRKAADSQKYNRKPDRGQRRFGVSGLRTEEDPADPGRTGFKHQQSNSRNA